MLCVKIAILQAVGRLMYTKPQSRFNIWLHILNTWPKPMFIQSVKMHLFTLSLALRGAMLRNCRVGAHIAPDGLQETLWSPFGASRPGWGPYIPRHPPGASVETVWGLPARFGPTKPQMASRRLCGACLGLSGPVRVHNASEGLREPLWRPFGDSRPGAGPQGPRWLPGSSVEHLWSLPGLAVSQSTLYVLWSYANNSTGWLP